jgi:hypothetical protein
MVDEFVDKLISLTHVDLDSPSEWLRAHLFFYDALSRVHSLLPHEVQKQLSTLGPPMPIASVLDASRVALWNSIEDDSAGNTPEGAAVRAALFAFYLADSDGPLDAIALFCRFFLHANLPPAALVNAFHTQWPQEAGSKRERDE